MVDRVRRKLGRWGHGVRVLPRDAYAHGRRGSVTFFCTTVWFEAVTFGQWTRPTGPRVFLERCKIRTNYHHTSLTQHCNWHHSHSSSENILRNSPQFIPTSHTKPPYHHLQTPLNIHDIMIQETLSHTYKKTLKVTLAQLGYFLRMIQHRKRLQKR